MGAGAAALSQAALVVESALAALLVSGELGERALRVGIATLGECGPESIRALVMLLVDRARHRYDVSTEGQYPTEMCVVITAFPGPAPSARMFESGETFV